MVESWDLIEMLHLRADNPSWQMKFPSPHFRGTQLNAYESVSSPSVFGWQPRSLGVTQINSRSGTRRRKGTLKNSPKCHRRARSC